MTTDFLSMWSAATSRIAIQFHLNRVLRTAATTQSAVVRLMMKKPRSENSAPPEAGRRDTVPKTARNLCSAIRNRRNIRRD